MRVSRSELLMRSIPSSGESIPALGLGTYNVFDVGAAPSERAPLKEVLKLFADSGARVIDSSPMYGSAETVAGELAAELGITDDLFIATKIWAIGKQAGILQMENAFRLFCTDVIDLMQVHNLADWETHLETIRSWKEQGRVRYAGVTHYSTGAFNAMERVIKNARPDFVQLYYSITTRQAEDRLLPLAADLGVGVIVNRPLETGGLFARVRGNPLPGWARDVGCSTWSQFFLKFVLSHPAVTCVIPATGNRAHLIDNVPAVSGPMPDKKMREKMAQYVEDL